jgi:two-component system nitrate/nitrite response regulator NarL
VEQPRLLIIDDEALFAESIGAQLEHAGYNVTGIFTDVGAAAGAVIDLGVDVVLLSPEHDDDVTALESVRRLRFDVRVLLLRDAMDHERVTHALNAGYRGVVGKDVSLGSVITAVDAVVRGDIAVEPSPPPHAAHLRTPVDEASLVFLTRRERQVLSLLVQGASGTEIADELSLSPHTVRTHVHNLMHKLQVHNRAEAVSFAVRTGLVSVEAVASVASRDDVAS